MVSNSGIYTVIEERKMRAALRIKITNPKERLKVYRFMLKTVKFRKKLMQAAGFCTCFPVEYEVFSFGYAISLFPELLAYKPKKKDFYGWDWWFSPYNYITRTGILLKIIKELKETIKTPKAIFDPHAPRIFESHTIMRDKKKPYTVFSHCWIGKGDPENGIDNESLKTDLSFGYLSTGTTLSMTREDANIMIAELLKQYKEENNKSI
jgi:hypothetical protein